MYTNVIDMFLYQCKRGEILSEIAFLRVCMHLCFQLFFYLTTYLDTQMCIKFDCDMFNTVQHRAKSDLELHFHFYEHTTYSTQVHENENATLVMIRH